MLKIGEFSKLARVSVKTLRYYADLGLLKPAYVDRFSGYRYYSLDQLPRLNRILGLKELGFALVEIEQLLRGNLGAGELQQLMRLKHAELSRQLESEQARLERVAVRLRQIEQEGMLPQHEVVVRRVEGCEVAGIRETVSGYRDLGELFAELYSYLERHGGSGAIAGPPVAIYYDGEYRDQGVDVEVVAPLVAGRVRKGSGRVSLHTLPPVAQAASLVCSGPYENLANVYGVLFSWTQRNGYRGAGPNREVYLQGPGPGVRPQSYVTEIQLPVQRTGALEVHGRKGATMEPKIVTKDAFTVVGLPFRGLISSGPYEDGENNNEIGLVWDELNRRWNELKHVSGAAIGLCFGMPNPEQPWYLAGYESSSDADVPPGMQAMHVGAQKYAVFQTTLGALGDTYRHIAEEWQPASGYRRAESPDFELYDESWNPQDPQNSPVYIYWPVQ